MKFHKSLMALKTPKGAFIMLKLVFKMPKRSVKNAINGVKVLGNGPHAGALISNSVL